MVPSGYVPQPGPVPAWAAAPQLTATQPYMQPPMPVGPPPMGAVNTATMTTTVTDGWGAMFFNMIQQQEMQQMQSWFATVDRNRDGTVEAQELAGLTFDGIPLGIIAASRLIRVFDKDRFEVTFAASVFGESDVYCIVFRNGKLDFREYCTLHKFIQVTRNAFVTCDADRSGRIGTSADEFNETNATGNAFAERKKLSSLASY